MKIKIYQVNMDRDKNKVAFVNSDSLSKFQGASEIESGIYDLVFKGMLIVTISKISTRCSI